MLLKILIVFIRFLFSDWHNFDCQSQWPKEHSGLPFGIFISLAIISFSLAVKETSRAPNHPVRNSKCTSNLVSFLGIKQLLVIVPVLTRASIVPCRIWLILNWLVYLPIMISWEKEPSFYLPASSFGQMNSENCGESGGWPRKRPFSHDLSIQEIEYEKADITNIIYIMKFIKSITKRFSRRLFRGEINL